MDEHHGCSHKTPDDHDPGNPDTGSDPLQDQVAGDFKQKIANEEKTGTQTVNTSEYGIINAQHLPELQFCKTNVNTVDVCNDIAKEKKGNQPPGDFGINSRRIFPIQDNWIFFRFHAEKTTPGKLNKVIPTEFKLREIHK
jgi:hypothetical protein